MRYRDCSICGSRDVPLNETIMVDGSVYCRSCAESAFPLESDLAGKVVEREVDPTVCAVCNTDFGYDELSTISSQPVCDSCRLELRNRAVPTRVKGFFVAIMLIVGGSLAWNLKYFLAYGDVKESQARLEMLDYAGAAAFMSSASNRVPDLEDLAVAATYYRGLDHLANGRSTEALAELNKCIGALPEEYEIDALIQKARLGSSFDKGDYRGFLDASLRLLERDSTEGLGLASVASAYACVYASEGEESAKENAIRYLQRAMAADASDKEMLRYYNMIEYRIESRRIISRAEFDKQFPNGWTKN